MISLRRPVEPAIVTCPYGMRANPFTGLHGQHHPGIDFRAALGQPVMAAADGIVARSYHSQGDGFAVRDPRKRIFSYGECIVIRHDDGSETRYAHLDQRLVVEGNRVAAGQVIGQAGASGDCTGPHVHFEFRATVDPAPYFEASNNVA